MEISNYWIIIWVIYKNIYFKIIQNFFEIVRYFSPYKYDPFS